MKKVLFFFLFILISVSVNAQAFQKFIQSLNRLPENARQAKVDSFLTVNRTYPLIEDDTICNFIYTGDAADVKVAGDFTGWRPSGVMSKIAGTNFWYSTVNFDADARLDYKIVINSNDWILDPGNPKTCVGGYGPNSELRMPACQTPPEIEYYPAMQHGTMWDTVITSKSLGEPRKVRVYLPPGYGRSAKVYPLILFHDGQDYIAFGAINNILDYLIAQHKITEVIAVFVPPVSREPEFIGNKVNAYCSFFVDELIPEIDRKFTTSKDPHHRAVGGVSNGGNISLYLGLIHPEVFGKIIAQSSSVFPFVMNGYKKSPGKDLQFYIDIGKYDIPELITLAKELTQTLGKKKYVYQYREWHEGHSWGNWKGHLAVPLMQFFPYDANSAIH
ncbi:MAG: alpha/beta hydrolase-fold protein [Bacteroidetes bacterium]|nr:alpha/beta hydrolase-fold protein [Bacteroidota bacterium]